MFSTSSTAQPSRLYFLDNLRTFMIFLVVALHAGLVYESTGMAGFFWIVYDFSTNLVVDELNLFLDIFIMAIIFFISGYVTPRSLTRKSAWTFTRSKLRRLMLPWALGVLLLLPLYKVIFLASRGMPQEHWTTYFYFNNGIFSQSWLWFLPVLFLFNMIYLVLSRVHVRTVNLSFTTAVVLVFVLGTSNSVLMDVLGWQGWTKNAVLNFQNERLLLYAMMFLVGAMSFNKQTDSAKSKTLYISALLVTWIPLVLYRYFYLKATAQPAVTIFSPILDSVLLWVTFYVSLAGLMIVLIYTFRLFFNTHGKISRRLAANSYAVYIIHTVVLGGIAMLLLNLALASIIKFLILTIITFVGSNILIMLFVSLSRFLINKMPNEIVKHHHMNKSYTVA